MSQSGVNTSKQSSIGDFNTIGDVLDEKEGNKINLKNCNTPNSTFKSTGDQEDVEGNFSPISNTNTTLSVDQFKAEEQLSELLKEKERIDNDNTLDKKRKQNLKKKLRKKIKNAASKVNNVSICDTEDIQDQDTERKFDLDKDNFSSINIDINNTNHNKDLIPK